MLRFLNGSSKGDGNDTSSVHGLASVGRKILERRAKSSSTSSGASSRANEISVKTLRSLYSSLLAEISTSTNGNYIEYWGLLGGQKDNTDENINQNIDKLNTNTNTNANQGEGERAVGET
jgi:hypothetical protein